MLSSFEQARVPPRLKVPVTVLLRIEAPRDAIVTETISARLETYMPDQTDAIEIEGGRYPDFLEAQTNL